MGVASPARRSPVARSTTSPLTTVVRRSAWPSTPDMCRTSSAGDVSDAGSRAATVRPARRTVKTSLIWNTSSMRCEMKRTLAPVAVISRTTSNRRSRVATSSAEVDSSRMSTAGSATTARATQHAWRSDRDRLSMGASRSTGAPRRRARIVAARSRRSSMSICLAREPTQTFSSTVLPGIVRTSWKTVATPRRRASEGDRIWCADCPPTVIVPESGRWTAARIFTKVLLPDPFSPMTVCTSPARTSRSAPERARVAPKDFVTPRTSTSDPAGAVRPEPRRVCRFTCRYRRRRRADRWSSTRRRAATRRPGPKASSRPGRPRRPGRRR